MNTLALVVRSGESVVWPSTFGQWAMLFTGIVVVCCIVYAIMRSLEAPPLAYKIGAVIVLVLLLVLAISFFFGG